MVSRLLTSLAAALLAAPVMAAEVNVYSYRQPELIKPLTDAFTKDTGIDVNVAFLSKGMIERLRAEGGRTPADVVLTTDVSRLAALVNAGLTQPITSDVLQQNVPAQYHDPAGHWWGLTSRARVVYASKTRVAADEITTYEDLADPKWQGRICTRSGTHPYNLALTAAMIEHHGVDAARVWAEGVKANLARRPQGNDRAQVKAIWAGECDISLGNTYYMGQMLADPEQQAWADAVRLDFPVFEMGGTHVNLSGVAMTKYAPNAESAKRFIEFLSTPAAQKIYAEVNFEYPIAPNTEADPLVKSWGSFTADGLDLMSIAKSRPAALQLMEMVDFDG